MSNTDGAQFRQETLEFVWIYSILDYICKIETQLTISYWNKMKCLNDITGNQFMNWKNRVQEFTLSHEYTVCMLLKVILDPRPTNKPKVTYMFAFLPSSASLGCCGLTHFPVLNPNNPRAKKKKKADVWVLALKTCPSHSPHKLGPLHLNWQMRFSKKYNTKEAILQCFVGFLIYRQWCLYMFVLFRILISVKHSPVNLVQSPGLHPVYISCHSWIARRHQTEHHLVQPDMSADIQGSAAVCVCFICVKEGKALCCDIL